MSYENCGSAHQIEELDHEFDNSAFDLNKLLDQALSRKHAKHDYEDPIIHHFSRYNSNHLIRLHAADKSFNSYEGGSVAELTAVEIHRDENDIPLNHQSNASALQTHIETRDKRPQSDAPLQNIHENSKLATNKSHTSSAKRLDVLEDQSQDGKVPHYFKDQYQNTRKTSAAKDDYGLSGELNKNSHSEQNQSHPYNNNSLTDSEKISEIMHLAYLKGRGQGTEPSDGGAGIEFMSKEPSMIELSNKDFENSPKATEEDYLEEYKYEESEQRNPSHNHNVQISNQLREILVPISQAENESEDSESERISPSDLLPEHENENSHKTPERKHHIEDLSESQEVIAIDNRKGSLENKRDEKAMRGQRYPTEVSPASASESIEEFVASRFSGISPRDPRGSLTKGDTLTEGQLLSSRSQKEGEERVETQENRETEGEQLETHEKIQEQSEEEEEIENFQTCQSQEIVAEDELSAMKRVNQEGKAIEGTDVIHEQSLEEEELEDFKSCVSGEIAEVESGVVKRVNQEENIFGGAHVIHEQSEEEETESMKSPQSQVQHQEKLVEVESNQREASNQEGAVGKETETVHEKNEQETKEEEESVLGVESEVIEVSNQEEKVNEEVDVKRSDRKKSENLDHVGSDQHHQNIGQSEDLAENTSSAKVQDNEAVESAQMISADHKNNQEKKNDVKNDENLGNNQAEKASNEAAAKRVGEHSDLQESEVQGTSEIKQTLEENVHDNDQKTASALVKTENTENVNQDSSEIIQKEETKNENNSVNNNVQESMHNSENKVGNQNENEKETTLVEKKENRETENNSDERAKEADNIIEQTSEVHESEAQGASKIRQNLEGKTQENGQKNPSAVEIKTQEELAKTETLKSTERVEQDPSEAVEKKENNAINSVQGDTQEESKTVSGNRGDNNQAEKALYDKEETELNHHENTEINQHERVKETGNMAEQSSEMHEGTSETRQALSENVKGDSQKDSSIAQEEVIKTDVSQQLAGTAQEEETNIEKKTQNTARSVHDDAQKESHDISENRVESHDENIKYHDKDAVSVGETKVSGNSENKDEENTEGQNQQAAAIKAHKNQEEANAGAQEGKRYDGDNVSASAEQKKEAEGVEEQIHQNRKVSISEETKEAREDNKKSSHERNIDESKPQDHFDGSEVTGSVKELEATEATARNRENDADNLTETQNETDAHTEKLDEKLISVVGSVKEFGAEEGTPVNQDTQIVTEEVFSEVQHQETNETEKRQNKLASGAESMRDSEAKVIVENKTDQQEASRVQAGSSEGHQETEIQKKEEDNSEIQTHTQKVKSNEGVTSHDAAVDLAKKDSETPETIVANKESHVVPHTQAQNEIADLAVQQNREVEKSQEKIASKATEESSSTQKQEDEVQKKNAENGKNRPEVHHKEEENVSQEEPTQQENLNKGNQQSEVSHAHQQSSVSEENQGTGQQSKTENSSLYSEIQKEVSRPVEISHDSHDKTQSTKNPDHLHSETKINSTHNNTIKTVDEEHKSSSSEITHNILDLTKDSAEVKRASKGTSPQKASDQFILDPNDKLQIKQLLEQIQEEESKENMISPQHIQTQQEQPTQEIPYNAGVSTPVKSNKRIPPTTATASTGTDFILHKTQIEEKGTQTEAEAVAVAEEKEVLPAIPIQKLTHFRSLSTTKKKQRSTFRLFEKSVGEYEKDIDFMSKYTTKEVIQNLDHTPEQMEALFESAKKLYKITDETPRGPPSDDELDGILNRVVVARSPVKEGRFDHSLIPIYQQVEEAYDDGTRYEGEKFLGKRHGTGTYYYKEGYKYVGNWEQDVMSGFGVLWLNENEKWYEGEWANNVFHGRGSLYNTDPEKLNEEKTYLENFDEIGNGWKKYEGQFFEGKRHRFGTILLSNGDVFVGNFKDNKAEGRGSYTKANKKMIVGEWCDNKLKKVF